MKDRNLTFTGSVMVNIVPQTDNPKKLYLIQITPKLSISKWNTCLNFKTGWALACTAAPQPAVGTFYGFPPPGLRSCEITSACDGKHARTTAYGSLQSVSMIGKCCPIGKICGLRPGHGQFRSRMHEWRWRRHFPKGGPGAVPGKKWRPKPGNFGITMPSFSHEHVPIINHTN